MNLLTFLVLFIFIILVIYTCIVFRIQISIDLVSIISNILFNLKNKLNLDLNKTIRFLNSYNSQKLEYKDVGVISLRKNNINIKILYGIEPDNNSYLLFYYYGGGFFMGSCDWHFKYFEQFVKKHKNITVVMMEYPLSDSYKYPFQLKYCYYLSKNIIDNISGLCNHVDKKKVIIYGSSSGCYISLYVLKMLYRDGYEKPKLNIMIYPWLQMITLNTSSFLRYSDNSQRFIFSSIICSYIGIETSNANIGKALYILESNTLFLFVKFDMLKKIFNMNNIELKYRKDYNLNFSYNIPDFKKIDFEILKKMLKLIQLSPLLDEDLNYIVDTYFVSYETDPFKDEGHFFRKRLMELNKLAHFEYVENDIHGNYENNDLLFPKLDLYLKNNL